MDEPVTFEVRLRNRRGQRELARLQKVDYERVTAMLKALPNDARPQGCEKLHDDIYRLRVGDIRIVYLIDEECKRIEVGGMQRRREKSYQGIDDLF